MMISFSFRRNVPRNPRLVGGVKGHNMNGISFAHILFATACPGSSGLWPGSFTFRLKRVEVFLSYIEGATPGPPILFQSDWWSIQDESGEWRQ